jgi:RimJ/RimL family protein N-acetyltransferase
MKAMNAVRLIPIKEDGSIEGPFDAIPQIARKICVSTLSLYKIVGFTPPWIGYLVVEFGRFVGTCAFKAAPSENRVEIAYYTFPRYQKKGYATQTVRAMIDIAAKECPGIAVTAQTVPEENGSASILKKIGFAFSGRVQHPEDGLVWEWSFQTLLKEARQKK